MLCCNHCGGSVITKDAFGNRSCELCGAIVKRDTHGTNFPVLSNNELDAIIDHAKRIIAMAEAMKEHNGGDEFARRKAEAIIALRRLAVGGNLQEDFFIRDPDLLNLKMKKYNNHDGFPGF